MNKILIIEDDLEINALLADFLKEKGYAVHCQYDGLHVLDFLNKEKIDLIILDIMLPYRSGDIILSDVRKKFTIPVIIISAKETTQNKIDLLRLGADDYITKPFDTELLLYKIKAILQRSSTLENEEQEQFKISNIFFDSMLRQLRVGDNEYKLSPKENELLKLLCLHRNDFMPRDLALRKIWKKENYFTARSMDVYIAKLRKLLKEDEGLEIINVHGEGFRLLVKN